MSNEKMYKVSEKSIVEFVELINESWNDTLYSARFNKETGKFKTNY